MKLSEISMLATVATTFYVHFKNLKPSIQAKRRLKKAVRKKGGDSVIWGMGLDFAMLDDPNSILNGSDDPEIHNLKMDLINKWKGSWNGHRFTIIWLLCGFAITVVIGILETLL